MQDVLDSTICGVTTGTEEDGPLFGLSRDVVGGKVLLCSLNLQFPIAPGDVKLSEVPVFCHDPRRQYVTISCLPGTLTNTFYVNFKNRIQQDRNYNITQYTMII